MTSFCLKASVIGPSSGLKLSRHHAYVPITGHRAILCRSMSLAEIAYVVRDDVPLWLEKAVKSEPAQIASDDLSSTAGDAAVSVEAAVSDIVSEADNAAASAQQAISGLFSGADDAAASAQEAVSGLFSGGDDAAASAQQAISGLFSGADDASASAQEAVSGMFSGGDDAQGAASGLLSGADGAAATATAAVSGLLSTADTAAASAQAAVSGLFSGAGSATSGVVGQATSAIDAASAQVGSLFSGVGSSVSETLSAAQATTAGLTSGVTSSITSATSGLVSSLEATSGALVASGQGVYTSLPPPVQDALGAASSAVGTVAGVAAQYPIPITIATGAAVAPLAYSWYTDRFGGYSGELSPEVVLELLSERDALLVDIRPLTQREAQGMPELKLGARLKAATFPLEDVLVPGYLSGSVRSRDTLRVETAAVLIVGLAKVKSPLTPIIVMSGGSDSTARQLARALRVVGQYDAYVMSGGFQGWVKAELPVLSERTDYDDTVTSIVGDQLEVLAKVTSEGVAALANPSVAVPLIVGVTGVGVAVANYHTTLQYIGILGTFFLIYRKLSAYSSVEDLLDDISTTARRVSKSISKSKAPAPAARSGSVQSKRIQEVAASRLKAAIAASATAPAAPTKSSSPTPSPPKAPTAAAPVAAARAPVVVAPVAAAPHVPVAPAPVAPAPAPVAAAPVAPAKVAPVAATPAPVAAAPEVPVAGESAGSAPEATNGVATAQTTDANTLETMMR